MPKYVTKKDCLKHGFIKTKSGICKITLLERYYLKGWLEYGNEKYSAQDRFKAAEALQQDYEMSRFMLISASGARQKIDCNVANGIEELEFICEARNRYFEAIKQIPDEFLSVIHKICLEGVEPELPNGLSDRRKLELSFSYKRDLCRGLDRLVQHYMLK